MNPQPDQASRQTDQPYPEDRYVRIKGIRVRYWVGGRGARAVVLIHGVGSYVERWLPTFRVLVRRFRVYALDLPGRGLSDKPVHFSYHVSNLARFVKSFSEAMGLTTQSLVGSSFGGAVAAHFARLYPESVDRLVLSSSAGWGRGVTPVLRLVGIPILGELIGTRQTKEATRRLLRNSVHDPSVVTEDLVDLHYRMNSQPGAWPAFLRLLRANGNILGQSPSVFGPLMRELRGFGKPVLILWGDQDRIIPPAHLRNAMSVLPHAETRVISGSGHFLTIEKPDEYAEAVLHFLEKP
jgi:pimeloyl-ACP methyl ester carboxylesterase